MAIDSPSLSKTQNIIGGATCIGVSALFAGQSIFELKEIATIKNDLKEAQNAPKQCPAAFVINNRLRPTHWQHLGQAQTTVIQKLKSSLKDYRKQASFSFFMLRFFGIMTYYFGRSLYLQSINAVQTKNSTDHQIIAKN